MPSILLWLTDGRGEDDLLFSRREGRWIGYVPGFDDYVTAALDAAGVRIDQTSGDERTEQLPAFSEAVETRTWQMNDELDRFGGRWLREDSVEVLREILANVEGEREV